MSSRNKRETLAKAMDDALDIDAPTTSQSLREIDAGIYSAGGMYNSLDLPEVEHLSASGMPINNIYPHPAQPRRVLPTRIRQAWKALNNDATQLGRIFDTWVAEVEQERRGRPFNVPAYLNQTALSDDFDATDDHPETPGPSEMALLHLLELAVSIKNQRLMNPISVAMQGKSYMIETGERRWFAYQLLYYYTQDKKFTTIPARIVPQVDVWRQATENTARQNLNAIGRARQLAILIMDLLKNLEEAVFAPVSEFPHEMGYYAQVSDGMDTRIPRNSADKLLAATGLKTKEQLRNHRRLLRLPVKVWEVADDLNWPERFIRDLVADAHGDVDKLIEVALKQAENQGYNVSLGTLSTDTNKNKRKSTPKNTGPNSAVYYAEFVKLLSKAGPGKETESHAALERIAELRRFLDEQEHQLRRFLTGKNKL